VNKLVASLALAAVVASAAIAPAHASHFSAHPGSSLQFSAAYQGEEFTGRFTRFEAAIRFDPKNLASSRLDVRIPLASARTDNAERDEMLVGPEFFDAGATPEARYEATRVVRLKDGRFRADGTLTLRGVSKPVPLLFTWTDGAMPTLTGEAVVNRLDFGVGSGDWEDLELIPNRVKISTRLVLGPQARVKVPEAATK
jgi:polyisoprenoid-binding protein YceI